MPHHGTIASPHGSYTGDLCRLLRRSANPGWAFRDLDASERMAPRATGQERAGDHRLLEVYLLTDRVATFRTGSKSSATNNAAL
jgi:hypothetical protein